MISRTSIEALPNEILLKILSYLSWYDMLTSLWSLNIRFDYLACSSFSIDRKLSNTGLVFALGLSYNKFARLFPLILECPSLCSSIQRIHFNETNSIACDLMYELLFNDKKILHFPNLKSLIVTKCQPMEPIIQCFSYLIEHQLDELTLTFDERMIKYYINIRRNLSKISNKAQRTAMIKQLVSQLFSSRCHLTSLRLDISKFFVGYSIHKCLSSNSYSSLNSTEYRNQLFCLTLRRLHIRLKHCCFLESLIEYVPNLEELLVAMNLSLKYDVDNHLNIEKNQQSNRNWFNKVSKLRFFSLKALINNDGGFHCLKWLLNNLNYVEKLQIHLKGDGFDERKSQTIWKSFIDANFVRQYCLPDTIINLIHFDFYICSQGELSFNDIEMIKNSFRNHSFFLYYQWTNVNCLFDPIMSYQHIFSSFTNTFPISLHIGNDLNIFNWPKMGRFCWNLYPSLYFILRGFVDKSTSNPSSITVYTGNYILRTNAFRTVQYAEFCFPSIHNGDTRKICDGKHFVPFFSKYMPHLQRLRLWRQDDFPWTSIRPPCDADQRSNRYGCFILRWLKSLKTPESIAQHATIFEHDLGQLFEALKEFKLIDIYGEIHYEKVESYRLMTETRFPKSRVEIDTSRFRLWI
ncbi:unnamed protein product [Rotaria magnacalcarata]|uniref:F-box domain-containing protein n=1 Tax=Rotaria magnacalcarata TaxID=392030 RepID=A0A816PU88_9BILA|nr:unnamed protein product [Rotaria magnacalcarata]